MVKLLRKLRKDEHGVTAIEYGLIVALISVAALIAMSAVGTSLNEMFNDINTALSDATEDPEGKKGKKDKKGKKGS